MPTTVAVIIPSLNEEARIEDSIASAWAAGADEVIVSDGGSSDATLERAIAAGARTLTSEQIRGRQMNVAAAAASADVLVFLHADTVLPPDAVERVREAVENAATFGGFLISFGETDWRLRIVAGMINLRTRLTKRPWGDQGQFITRDSFRAHGGFLEIPIMEDYELARRMKRRRRTTVISSPVVTSGRRFIERGILRTIFTNWRIIVAWRLGIAPERLARIYRR